MHTLSAGGASNLARTLTSKFGWKLTNKKASYDSKTGYYAIKFDLTKEQYFQYLE